MRAARKLDRHAMLSCMLRARNERGNPPRSQRRATVPMPHSCMVNVPSSTTSMRPRSNNHYDKGGQK